MQIMDGDGPFGPEDWISAGAGIVRASTFMESDPERAAEAVRIIPAGVVRAASIHAPSHSAATLRAMADAGARLWIVEGICALTEIDRFVEISRRADTADIPVVFSMAVAGDGHTLVGDHASVNDFCRKSLTNAAYAVGANCGLVPSDILRPLPEIVTAVGGTGARIFLAPCGGAGFSRAVRDAMTLIPPDLDSIIGGCCGTTPADIAGI